MLSYGCYHSWTCLCIKMDRIFTPNLHAICFSSLLQHLGFLSGSSSPLTSQALGLINLNSHTKVYPQCICSATHLHTYSDLNDRLQLRKKERCSELRQYTGLYSSVLPKSQSPDEKWKMCLCVFLKGYFLLVSDGSKVAGGSETYHVDSYLIDFHWIFISLSKI